ncbi:MAG: hypothetical protein ACLP9L_06855 [Thermoguttaceae bacterium]
MGTLIGYDPRGKFFRRRRWRVPQGLSGPAPFVASSCAEITCAESPIAASARRLDLNKGTANLTQRIFNFDVVFLSAIKGLQWIVARRCSASGICRDLSAKENDDV